MEFLRKNLPIITLGILIIGLLAYIDNRFGRLETELRTEIKEVRTELKTDIAQVRGEIKEVRTELTAQISRLNDKMDTLILSLFPTENPLNTNLDKKNWCPATLALKISSSLSLHACLSNKPICLLCFPVS